MSGCQAPRHPATKNRGLAGRFLRVFPEKKPQPTTLPATFFRAYPPLIDPDNLGQPGTKLAKLPKLLRKIPGLAKLRSTAGTRVLFSAFEDFHDDEFIAPLPFRLFKADAEAMFKLRVESCAIATAI